MLPEWAPNLHPLIVHFPLALLVVAVGFDMLAFAIRQWTWLRPAAIGLYVLGGLGTVLAYLTGLQAAETVRISTAVEPFLTEHADLGWWTMAFFGAYAVVRLGAAAYEKTRDRTTVQGVLCAIAFAGLFLLWETGEHGGQMVYRHGVGVAAAASQDAGAPSQTPGAVGLVRRVDGWTWTPQTPAEWTQQMQWMGNPTGELRTRLVETEGGSPVLSLRMEEAGRLMFVVPDTLGDVQVEATLDATAFEGTVQLAYHVRDTQNYAFLALSGSTMQLGRVQQGEAAVLDTGTFAADGWITVRATADGDHFRGYVDDEMIAHGHGTPLPSGYVGLQIEGEGPVLIRQLLARAIGE